MPNRQKKTYLLLICTIKIHTEKYISLYFLSHTHTQKLKETHQSSRGEAMQMTLSCLHIRAIACILYFHMKKCGWWGRAISKWGRERAREREYKWVVNCLPSGSGRTLPNDLFMSHSTTKNILFSKENAD